MYFVVTSIASKDGATLGPTWFLIYIYIYTLIYKWYSVCPILFVLLYYFIFEIYSHARRDQLIKSVVFGVQVYWSQIFILPQKVLKMVQTACRVFLWTGKAELSRRALATWEKVMLPQYPVCRWFEHYEFEGVEQSCYM